METNSLRAVCDSSGMGIWYIKSGILLIKKCLRLVMIGYIKRFMYCQGMEMDIKHNQLDLGMIFLLIFHILPLPFSFNRPGYKTYF